jgi:cobalt-precorrin-5B (C1)-methyltransferase
MLECVACDDALRVLQEENIYEDTMKHLTSRVQQLLNIRAGEDMEVGAVLFSKVYGLLGKTSNTEKLIEKIMEE